VGARDNTSDELLTAVRRDSFMAQSGQSDNWTDPRILGIADDCMLEHVAPTLKRAKVGWFREDFTIDTVTDQARYDVPQEAMWNGLEALWLTDPVSGVVSSKIQFVDSSNRMLYGSLAPGVPQFAWFDQNQLVLSPPPDSGVVNGFSMTASMYRRPGQLVLMADTCTVTAVNPGTQDMTVTTVPSAFTADPYESPSLYHFDLYSRVLPNQRQLFNATFDVNTPTSITPNPLLSAADLAKIVPGTVVTMTRTSPFPDLPWEAVPYLRRMVIRTILTAQTDFQALQVYLGQQAEGLANLLRGMSDRADGSARKLSLANAGASKFMRNYGARYRGR
jgi:hypothetical protein